jgi:3-oxoacyl-[acyl-carrier-protein] synthase II
VTGVGVVTPLGVGLEETWSNILKGKSGVVSLKDESFVEGIDIKIGGKLPPNYDAEKYQTKVRHYTFDNLI